VKAVARERSGWLLPANTPRTITSTSGTRRSTMLMFCMAAAVFIPRRLIMVNNTISPIAIALVTGSENANSSWNGVTAARARDAMEPEAVSRKPEKPFTKPARG